MWSPKHKCFPKTKRNGAAPALTRSEVRLKRGRDNAVAEVRSFGQKPPCGCRRHYETL
jgi:hypothetical protein